jgi:hypothetical protein
MRTKKRRRTRKNKRMSRENTKRKTKDRSKLTQFNERHGNMFLYYANEEEYIEQSTSQTIASWKSSHRKAITSSAKKWTAIAQSGSTGIVGWMRGEENNDAINRLHARQRQDFLNEERTRKERRKKARRRRRRAHK